MRLRRVTDRRIVEEFPDEQARELLKSGIYTAADDDDENDEPVSDKPRRYKRRDMKAEE